MSYIGLREERGKMLIDGIDVEAWEHHIFGGIGLDLRGVKIQLFAPNEARPLALLHNPIEEAPKDGDAVAVADFSQTGVVRQRFMQIIAQIPAQAESVGSNTQ
jgi:hypothetical protein